MTRNLKALGLALLALVAMGVLGAQGASASTHTFTSDENETVLTGHQVKGTEDKFSLPKAGGGTVDVKCKSTTFSHTNIGKSVSSITIHPKYSECKLGAINANVTTDGCNYVFTGKTTTSPHLVGEHAVVHVECEAGHNIIVSGGGCVLTIGAQENLHGVTYKKITEIATHPSGTKDKIAAVTVKSTVRTITAKATGANCGLVGLENGKTYTTGEYDGDAEVAGYKDLGTFGTTTAGQTFTEGALVNIGFTTHP